MKRTAFGYSVGALDSLDISGNQLTCSGWTLSLEGHDTERLEIMIDGVPVDAAVQFPLPSPDVQAAWPALRGGARCRFVAHARLDPPPTQQAADGMLVSVCSYDGNGLAGLPLERAWPVRYEAASGQESDLVGRGDFLHTAFSFLSIFRLVAGLRRDDHVLDAGCGLGRMAFGLAHYLDASGRYEGFDISANLVASARTRFAALPNFRFTHADIYNKMYNPLGKLRAREFAFPYRSESFSFVFLTSVFTHMLAADVQGYLHEIRRVLQPGGRCVATFFVMDDEARLCVEEGRSTIRFVHRLPDGCYIEDPEVPENAVAYGEEALARMISSAGLRATQVHKGSWPGRARFLTYQDVYVLEPSEPPRK